MLSRFTIVFILLAVLVTTIAGLISVTVQQTYRQSANDPQIEQAASLSTALGYSINPVELIKNRQPDDLSTSLSTFIIIYDNDHNVLASTGMLKDDAKLSPPQGTFDYAKQHGKNIFTWAPQKDIREAVVLQAAPNDKGFVLVGRSLKEVEVREHNLTITVALAWIVMIGICFLLAKVLTAERKNLA